MTEGKWIKFEPVTFGPKYRKTASYDVTNKNDGSYIGRVKWYGPWRQYSFFPNENTVYERQCLMDIAKFLNHLMVERKMKKQLITNPVIE